MRLRRSLCGGLPSWRKWIRRNSSRLYRYAHAVKCLRDHGVRRLRLFDSDAERTLWTKNIFWSKIMFSCPVKHVHWTRVHDFGAEEIYKYILRWRVLTPVFREYFREIFLLFSMFYYVCGLYGSYFYQDVQQRDWSRNCNMAIAACLEMLSILTGFWWFSGTFQTYTVIIFQIWTLHIPVPRHYSRTILSFRRCIALLLKASFSKRKNNVGYCRSRLVRCLRILETVVTAHQTVVIQLFWWVEGRAHLSVFLCVVKSRMEHVLDDSVITDWLSLTQPKFPSCIGVCVWMYGQWISRLSTCETWSSLGLTEAECIRKEMHYK
jgi:hypothetical protein